MIHLNRHLSYANVVATLALVFAMSGSAIAAKHYLITSTGQIKPSVLRKLQGTTGKAGATGLAGAPGANGTNGTHGTNGTDGATHVVSHYVEATTLNGNDGQAEADCSAGEHATGGGVVLTNGVITKLWYFQHEGGPVPNTQGAAPTGWSGSWFNESGSTDTLRVYVICASP